MEPREGVPYPGDEGLQSAAFHYMKFLQALGIWDIMEEEPKRRTPERVAYAFLEFFGNNLEPINMTTFSVPEPPGLHHSGDHRRQEVTVCDISFASLCSHHHLPFLGKCHVAYLPDICIVGLSKIARVVEHFTHGAMIQEDVTEAIANYLMLELRPRGVAVLMEAEHTCMAIRGVRKPGHLVRTLTTKGVYNEDAMMDRFIQLCRSRR